MGTDSKYSAPANADEFYRRDGDYIHGLARKLMGASGNSQDAEDAAADIMERLLSARNDLGENSLEQYRADFISGHTHQKVTWRQFLSGKVNLYMRGKREAVGRRNGRELLLCDSPAGDGTSRWVDLFGGQTWDDYDCLNDTEFFDRIQNYLATVPDAWEGPASLFEVFNELLDSAKAGERPALHMPKARAAEAMDAIRMAVREAVTAPPVGWFDVCGVRLSAVEVREAITLLRKGRGNHVHAPLRSHRLQLEGPKGWYHDFSDAEYRDCPEFARTDPQTHKKPADHVKRAVIHRLERMLAGAPDAPEEDEPTRMDVLESELWHISGLQADQVDAILAAVGKVYA